MTCKCWVHLLLLTLCYHLCEPAASKPEWMRPQFPCEVTTYNSSYILFDCEDSNLRGVPSGITSNVTELNLSKNSIRNITVGSFPHLPNLTRLDLGSANHGQQLNIAAGAFKNLTNLRSLRLAENPLTKFPSNLPDSVKILQMDSNKIIRVTERGLSNLRNVTELGLSRNCYFLNPCGEYTTVEDNSFSVMTKLEILDMSYNNLTKVPKRLPASLKSLKLGENRIQHISEDDFYELSNLTKLHIQGNCPRCHNAPYPCIPCQNISIDIHLKAFRYLTQLEDLSLGGNSLKYLEPSWFSSLGKLRVLLLGFNLLFEVVTKNAKFLQYLPKLEVLDISFNFAPRHYPTNISLAKEFSNLVSLRTLHLQGLVFQNIGSDTLRPLYGLKNLSTLNLGTNFIIHSDPRMFEKFSHLKLIYLGVNRLYPITVGNFYQSCDGYSQGESGLSVSPLVEQHPKEPTFELTHGLVKPECFDSGQVVTLSSNNIFFISPKQFEHYGNISCLNLSGNGFSQALNGSEFTSLPNLTYLDLSYNKIDLAYDNAFKELKKLQVLDLSYNSHFFISYGVTLNLNFTQNLPVLRVLNMSHNSISTLTTKRMYSKSLSELRFTDNYLGTLWGENEKSYKKLFTNLVNLTILDISFNNITMITHHVYENLPHTLIKLIISHNKLSDFKWDQMRHFPQLETLDLSFNSLTNVTGSNTNFTHTLTVLDLSYNQIVQLDDVFLNGIKSLQTLILSSNKLSIINQSTYQMLPGSKIKTLFLQNNPFLCTCDSFEFILWINNTDVKIPRLTTDVACDAPTNQKGQPLIYFGINECVDDNDAFLLYILTNSCIIILMFVATLVHLFYWDASYILHYVKARIKGYTSLNSPDSAYDVFVTYDTKDPLVSEWVLKTLRVKLEEEGEKHLPLCLEERDWPLGVPLIDNLTQSIRYSRKTLFVLTQNYVKTGGFKLAMYLAHQRLLDENVDVIVLLMLEPVLQHSHFLRLRRRLCGKSIVEWPRTAAAEPWFWQNLRSVVRVDNQVMYSKTYSRYFITNN